MKNRIIYIFMLFFLAVTFVTDSPPPGWYQQTLPVNDLITDIFFLDSLTGWIITDGQTSTNDTGYIMKTTNGGNNWQVQYNQPMKLNAVQFTDVNTGYVVGGSGTGTGRIFKTTNGGAVWININTFSTLFKDLFFVNKDTGWVCDDDPLFGVGIIKTTNGGANWIPQAGPLYRPQKLFFINRDTGWAGSSDWKLYRTTNGGSNWGLQYTFAGSLRNLFFVSRDTGFISGFFGSFSIMKTIDGGFNWQPTLNSLGTFGLFFVNSRIGYNCAGASVLQKTTNHGDNWFSLTVPAGGWLSVMFIDTLKGWAGGSNLIHTTDGGGPPAGIIKSNTTVSAFKLKQNYPNPFNGVTLIFFDLPKESRVDLIIYNILGEEVSELLDNEYFTAGTVQFGFNAEEEDLSSGVYFYRLTARAEDNREIFIDTKKMVLLK